MEREKIIVDAEGCVVGRLASYIAKQALLGKEVIVVNVDKAVISGKKENVLAKYIRRMQKGKGWQKGPYWPRSADKLFRRIVRGMLPWKKARGKEAFKRVKCYKGIPQDIEKIEKNEIGKEKIKMINPDSKYKKEFLNFITLGELEKLLKGGK